MLLKSERSTWYKAFGLCVESELVLPELPELPRLQQAEEAVPLRIVKGDSERLQSEWGDNPVPYKHIVQANNVKFYVPDVAYYSVCAGETITICPLPGTDESLIRLYLLGSCMGAALLQRGILPLHGSAIVLRDRVYAFVGESGAGKSTLASAFVREGCPLVSDDVIAIPAISSAEPTPMVVPSYPQQKLWQESLDHFGVDSRQFSPITGRLDKYCVPIDPSVFPNRPLPLAAIIELVKTEEPAVRLAPITGLERLQTLFWHTYRQFLLPRLGLMEWHFQLSTTLLQQVAMYRLFRPATGFTARELALQIESLVESGEEVG